MSHPDDFDFLRIVIEENDDPINTHDLLLRTEAKEMPFELADLVSYWKQGKLFASQINRTEKGFMPVRECAWTTKYRTDFFGFDGELGAYQATENMHNPITATLEATIPTDSSPMCVALHPNQREFAIGVLSGAIFICDLNNGAIVKTLRGSNSRTWTLAYSPSGNILLSGHQNAELLRWDQNGQLTGKVKTDDWVRSISFSPDEAHFLTSHRAQGGDDPSINQWQTNTFKQFGAYIHVSGAIWCIRYLLDGTGFVCAGHDKKVTLWSFAKDDIVWSEKKHTGTIVSLDLHPVGGVVASGAWTGSIKLWNLETGEDVRTIEAHSARTYGLSFSPSGRILASGGKDSQICLWQLPNGTLLSQFKGHNGWVRGLRFVDENTLISVGSEGTCKIWRLNYRLPIPVSSASYHSAQEVLNEYRRPVDIDDE